MQCPGCQRRFAPAAAEHMDGCPVCGAPWRPAAEPVLAGVAAEPAPADDHGAGGAWTLSAPEPAVPPPVGHGAPAPGPAWQPPADPPARWPAPVALDPVVVAPRARVGNRYADLVMSEHTIYLVPVPGGGPVFIPLGLAGVALSMLVRAMWARSRRGEDASRAGDLHRTPLAALASAAGARGTIRYDEVTKARLLSSAGTTTLRLKANGRRRSVLTWSNGQLSGVDLAGALQDRLGNRLTVKQGSVLNRIGLVLMVLVVGLAVVFGILGALGVVDMSDSGPGYAEARAACKALKDFDRRHDSQRPTQDDLVAVTTQLSDHLGRAAKENLEFAPAASSADRLEQFFSGGSAPMSADDVTAETRVVDAACVRAANG